MVILEMRELMNESNFGKLDGKEGMKWDRSRGMEVEVSSCVGGEVGAKDSSKDVSETNSITT